MVEADRSAASAVWHEARVAGEPWRPAKTIEEDETLFQRVSAKYTIWVAARGDNILGTMAVGPAYVDQLHVHPDAWRQGIGTALLDYAKTVMREGFHLFAAPENERACRFYEAQGMVEVGRLSNPSGELRIRFEWRPTESAGP